MPIVIKDRFWNKPSKRNAIKVEKQNLKGALGMLLLGFPWIILWLYIVHTSKPNLAFYHTDSYGNVCGEGIMKDKPYAIHRNIIQCGLQAESLPFTGCATTTLCVESCPKYDMTLKPFAERLLSNTHDIDNEVASSFLICGYDLFSYDTFDTEDYSKLYKKHCIQWYMPMVPENNLCLPTVAVHRQYKRYLFNMTLNQYFGQRDVIKSYIWWKYFDTEARYSLNISRTMIECLYILGSAMGIAVVLAFSAVVLFIGAPNVSIISVFNIGILICGMLVYRSLKLAKDANNFYPQLEQYQFKISDFVYTKSGSMILALLVCIIAGYILIITARNIYSITTFARLMHVLTNFVELKEFFSITSVLLVVCNMIFCTLTYILIAMLLTNSVPHYIKMKWDNIKEGHQTLVCPFIFHGNRRHEAYENWLPTYCGTNREKARRQGCQFLMYTLNGLSIFAIFGLLLIFYLTNRVISYLIWVDTCNRIVSAYWLVIPQKPTMFTLTKYFNDAFFSAIFVTLSTPIRVLLNTLPEMIEKQIPVPSKSDVLPLLLHNKSYFQATLHMRTIRSSSSHLLFTIRESIYILTLLSKFVITTIVMVHTLTVVPENYDDDQKLIVFFACAVCTFVVTGKVFGHFEATVKSIEYCCHEDLTFNDGSAKKPYYMHIDLYECICKHPKF